MRTVADAVRALERDRDALLRELVRTIAAVLDRSGEEARRQALQTDNWLTDMGFQERQR